MAFFARLSLSRQFLLASFPIMIAGTLAVGSWVATTIESGVVHRVGSVTGLYVDSFVAPFVQDLLHEGKLAETNRASLDALLTDTPLGQRIVSFKIWDPEGRVLYSTDEALIGRKFPVSEGLATALQGGVHSEVSTLSEAENESERRRWPRLIETYSPVHADRLGKVLAVAEFYQTTDELEHETNLAQLYSWLVVVGTMLTMYSLIFGLVQRGSRTIDAQRRELRAKVAALSALVSQNTQLHDRVSRAAARTTALNERFLRRIAADLHDGPGQDLGLALMRFESLADICGKCAVLQQQTPSPQGDFETIRSALKSALADLRAISAGLQLPEIERLPTVEIVARAVRDYERKSGMTVAQGPTEGLGEVSLPVKITLYRLLQESLSNGLRHGGGTAQRVDVSSVDSRLIVAVSDSGPGFDTRVTPSEGHVGLAGMRERVEILGGSFTVHSTPGRGTVIEAQLPMQVAGADDA